MLQGLFKGAFAPRPATLAGRKLFVSASAQARNADLYQVGQVPDTPAGRFELYTLHVVLVLHRLKGGGARAAETSQALFDAYVKNLDEGLRDMGVGDLSVGKKIRKLGEAFYGRTKGYDSALASLPDTAPLRALIGRTIFGAAEAPQAAALGDYAAEAAALLDATPLEAVLESRLRWPEFAHAA